MANTGDIYRGNQFVAYPEARPASRVYIQISRVAKDGTWADLRCMTWAVAWSKRMPLKDDGIPTAIRQLWNQDDLDAQEEDHMEMLRGKGKPYV